MTEKIKGIYLKYKKGIWHFIKFQCVGVVNFLVDYGVFTLLNGLLGWPVAIANTISYSCGIVNSFLLNRYWTFRIHLKFTAEYHIGKGKKFRIRFLSVDFIKFILINILGWGVNTLTMVILVNGYSLSAKGLGLFENFVPKLVATAFSFVVNFAGSKLLVFKEDKKPEAEGNKELLADQRDEDKDGGK
jgi:putative flippase GtrA